MLLAALAVAALLTVPFAGGRLGLLADLRLRGVPLLLGALGLQVVIISVLPTGDDTLYRWLHLGTYVVALVWLGFSQQIRWRWIIVAGGVSNFVVIISNGGVMPASSSAIEAAGLGSHQGFANSAATAHPTLGFLGDVFATPAWLPLHNVYSIGDALIVLGIFVVLHRQCESFLAYPIARAGDAIKNAFQLRTNSSQLAWTAATARDAARGHRQSVRPKQPRQTLFPRFAAHRDRSL